MDTIELTGKRIVIFEGIDFSHKPYPEKRVWAIVGTPEETDAIVRKEFDNPVGPMIHFDSDDLKE